MIVTKYFVVAEGMRKEADDSTTIIKHNTIVEKLNKNDWNEETITKLQTAVKEKMKADNAIILSITELCTVDVLDAKAEDYE